MNKIFYVLLCFLLFSGSVTLYAQDNVEITLPGSDATSGFQVLRSDTTLLFRVAGDGSLLIPGMTGANRRAIVSPVSGMVVFQNDETIGLYYFDGAEWRTLPLNSVTTATISNEAVTNAKIAAGAITADKIAPGVLSGALTPGSVTTGTLANNAVTSAKIADSTIVDADVSPSAAIAYSKLALNNSIANGDLTANSVTTSKVANGTVTTSKLADSAVSGLKLLTYAVTNRHIADGAVTPAKIDPTGASSGNVLQYNGTNVVWAAGGVVTPNSTLSGTGASGSPLGINLGNSNTWTGNQTFGGTFLITANSRIAMTNSDNNARDIRFQEPSGTGSQYIGLRAPSVTNNGNYVLPAVVGSVGQVLTLATSNGIDSATTYWSSSSLAAGSVGTTELADDAVTTIKILNSAVDNSKLGANSVTTSKVANGTVTTSKLADSAVSGLKLLTFAVTNRHLASGAVTGDKISYPLSMTAGNGSTALQVSSGRVALSYGEVTAANGGVAITDGPAIVVIRAGASAGFNITLPTGTHNGQLLTIYNSDGNTATVSSGNVLNAQTTIPTGTTREYIWVTTNSNSGWVGQ